MDPAGVTLHAGELVLLIPALILALGFECANGFHDTANAVATVIYTRSLPPWLAVIWSGLCNFVGVLLSSGTVAFAVINLLPVDLVTNVGSPIGFSMIFALLLSALLWNVGTWYLGIPVSSTHSMIGAILGVGLMNSLLSTHSLAAGANWTVVKNVIMALLFSPAVGMIGAAVLFLLLKALVRQPELYRPVEQKPPPWWIRGILCLTCTGVSYAHGSNDGQKGLGLFMLILASIIPGVYAVNPAVEAGSTAQLSLASQKVAAIIQPHIGNVTVEAQAVTETLISFLKTDGVFSNKIFPALAQENQEISDTLAQHKSLAELTEDERIALRREIYLTSGTIAKLDAMKKFSADEDQTLLKYKAALDKTIKFIPVWVKVVVAFALGLGTMVGWKRVVVTIGEKIGKAHLTYAQGASAEMIAMLTIGLATKYGLPVSTTHVLSSGIAGTMAANRSGLQKATLRNIILAWVLTLPACIFLGAMIFAAALQLLFHVFHVH
ncbi:MAG TPA: inorganic phosphate transporter [Candidatus Acidoferrum sp.]|jgi:PiT family inorganic phosphate transporter|nr:inorganic phosphate transporter [Candidatus Acidoferrum sp.]